MSVLFTDTMTVYNYYRDPDTEKESWIRSVVRGVQWSHNKREIAISGNVHGYGNKPYIPPQEYAKLSGDERGDYWTLDAKQGNDIMILGESEKEITKDYRTAQLFDDFQYAVTVKAVSDNRNRPRLKNIKAVGK